eukprot:2587003-Rhodomonas_salina.2
MPVVDFLPVYATATALRYRYWQRSGPGVRSCGCCRRGCGGSRTATAPETRSITLPQYWTSPSACIGA